MKFGSGHCWAVMADMPFQCRMEIGDSACGLADQDDGPQFQKRDSPHALTIGGSHYSSYEKLMPGH